ncbi:MAG: hypothetical protein FJ276_28690, partial [Planctomycetes bacterium]|nr:hypothetical protein [Planctomycetota bacterium]
MRLAKGHGIRAMTGRNSVPVSQVIGSRRDTTPIRGHASRRGSGSARRLAVEGLGMRQTLTNTLVFVTSGIAVLALLNSLSAYFFALSVTRSFREVVRDNLTSIKAAEELEIALLEQGGLVSAYILSEGDPSWLERRRKAESHFDHWLPRARTSAHTPGESETLDRLEEVAAAYRAKRTKAVHEFDRGQRSEAVSTLLHEVWPDYDRAFQLCEDFIAANEVSVERSISRAERYLGIATWCALVGSLGTASLATALLWMLIRRVITPLRRMIADARLLLNNESGTGGDA